MFFNLKDAMDYVRALGPNRDCKEKMVRVGCSGNRGLISDAR